MIGYGVLGPEDKGLNSNMLCFLFDFDVLGSLSSYSYSTFWHKPYFLQLLHFVFGLNIVYFQRND